MQPQTLQVLNELAEKWNHTVPNSQLHRVRTLQDAAHFYATPVANITNYTAMARADDNPGNLSVRETPARFHPNDTHAFHGGVDAFPAEGGQVISLRNKRIYRQFRKRKEWYDFEEQKFSTDRPDADMPWDPRTAERMDRYTDRKFQKNAFKKI